MASSHSIVRIQVGKQETQHHLAQMGRRVGSFVNTVRSIWVSKHRELFVVLDELVDQFFHGLVMTVVIASAVVCYSAQAFFIGAYRSLRFKSIGMDVPVALAIGLAYLSSCYATVTATGEVYFDAEKVSVRF